MAEMYVKRKGSTKERERSEQDSLARAHKKERMIVESREIFKEVRGLNKTYDFVSDQRQMKLKLLRLLEIQDFLDEGNTLTYPFCMPKLLKDIFSVSQPELTERIDSLLMSLQSSILLPLFSHKHRLSPFSLYELLNIIMDPSYHEDSFNAKKVKLTEGNSSKVFSVPHQQTFLSTYVWGMQLLESNFKSNFWNATSHMPPSRFGVCSEEDFEKPLFFTTINICNSLFQIILEVDERLSSSEAKDLIECSLNVAGMKGEELGLLHMHSESAHLKSYSLFLVELANPTEPLNEIFKDLPRLDKFASTLNKVVKSLKSNKTYSEFVKRLSLPNFSADRLVKWLAAPSGDNINKGICELIFKFIDLNKLNETLVQVLKIIYSENILLLCVYAAIGIIAPLIAIKNRWAVVHADVILHLVLRDEYTHIMLWAFLAEYLGEIIGQKKGLAKEIAKDLFSQNDDFLKSVVELIWNMAKEQYDTLPPELQEGALYQNLLVLGKSKGDCLIMLRKGMQDIVSNGQYNKETKYGKLLNVHLANLEIQSPLIMEVFNERIYSHF